MDLKQTNRCTLVMLSLDRRTTKVDYRCYPQVKSKTQ